MKIHQYETTLVFPVSLTEAWEFFAHPGNLDDITPPDLCFNTILGGDEPMFPGQIIVHKIKLAPLIWTNWVTEITEVEDESYFIDEQRSGPYKFWHHLHRFSEHEDGVEMLDRVHYALPVSPFGEIAALPIRKKIETIFEFRKQKLELLW